MNQLVTRASPRLRARRAAAAVVVALFAGACGGPYDVPGATAGGDTLADVRGGEPPVAAPAPDVIPDVIPDAGPGATPDADPAPSPAPAPAPVSDPAPVPDPAPAPVPAPVPDPAPAPGTAPSTPFSWTKPPDFDRLLADAIAGQPAYMGGYGGGVDNPFPHVPGTAWFSDLQITRPDAIVFGNHFGRPSYRFYVDDQSRHSNGLRAEFTGAADFRFVDGDTYNFKFGSYFSSEYRNSSWTEWNLFAQFHGPGFPAWGLKTSGGYLTMDPPGASSSAHRIPMPARERWHDFDWTIHWAHDATGWATLRIDGVLVFDYRGPTMHASESYYYPKFGSYLANNPYTQVTYSTPWVVTRR